MLGLMTAVVVCRADMAWQGFFAAPLDDGKIREEVQKNAATNTEIKVDAARYKLLENELTALTVPRIMALFPKVKGASVKPPLYAPDSIEAGYRAEYQPPAGYVLPVKYPHLVFVGGIAVSGDWVQYAPFFVAIGDAGGAYVVPGGGPEKLLAVVIYLKKDDTFVPLRQKMDFAPREKWEIERTEKLGKFIDAALKK